MSRLLYAMGIDPGLTTGWAVIGVDYNSVFRDYPGRIRVHDFGETTGDESQQVITLMSIASKYHPLAIALEDFDLHTAVRSHDVLAPVRIAARIEFCVDTSYTLANLFYQMPQLAMSTATDDRLKTWELYQPGSDHIKDATRHAITFIRRAKAKEALRKEAWGPYGE